MIINIFVCNSRRNIRQAEIKSKHIFVWFLFVPGALILEKQWIQYVVVTCNQMVASLN